MGGHTISQILGVLGADYFSCVVIDGAIWLLESGHRIEGLSTLVGAAVATLVAVFVWGKKYQTKQLAEKLAAEMVQRPRR